MSWIRRLLASAVVALVVLLPSVIGDLEPILQRCCQSGETWARNHTTCTGPPQESGSVPPQDRLTCLTSLYICCIRAHRRISCERGKEAAKEGRLCGAVDDTFRDCCDGCTLGIKAGITRMPCGFVRFSFGAPWDEAYIDCCERTSSDQGVSHHTGNVRAVCEPNNPCTQVCDVVDDKRIKCSCYPGFKLGPDQASCEDVNECALNTHTCNPVAEECFNLVGGFTCMSRDPAQVQECPPGYVRDRQKQTCEDFDECTLNPCPRDKECLNTVGSFVCEPKAVAQDLCPPGFTFSDVNGLCVDVDECGSGAHTCNRTTEICQNSHGGYQCIAKPLRSKDCPAGFKWSDLSGNCEDVDECVEETHTCNPSTQNCVNAVGSYRCVAKASCPHGFRWSGNKCEDVDECAEFTDDCDRRTHYCVNTVGSYQCQTKTVRINCRTGYNFDSRRNECIDINECEVLRPCGEDQVCENTEGSYSCKCLPGFTLDAFTRQCRDVNECQLGLYSCAGSQRCDNTIGSYTCVRITSCGTGYTLNAATNQCEDDDECVLNTHNCGPGFKCRNIQGSFRCDRVKCPPGQKLLTDGSCKVVVCGRGMEPDDAGNCVDINECARGNVCRTNQHCVNTVGSYRCQNLLNCPPGYELNEFGDNCEDVDECARRIYECGPQQTCRNRPGGYVCECPRGYGLNLQRECEDIDECTRFRGQVCSRISECINTQGSYVCNCKEGFRKADDDKNCVDIDECAESPNACQQTCINVLGSYLCSCQAGFTLAPDNRSCQDIDECKTYEGHGELCIGYCVNEPGSFSCSCPPGYRLSSEKRTCLDIDECQEQNVCSGEKEVCLNTRGGYKCNRIACPPNYVRDKDHRKDRGNNHDTVLCRKRCRSNDIDCILNGTQTITYQTIALPSVPYLQHPLILTTMRAVTSRSMSFGTDFTIVEGNERALFDILRGQGVGSLRLVRSIAGPQELLLKILMTIRMNPTAGSRFTSTSHHMAAIQIIVSQHDF